MGRAFAEIAFTDSVLAAQDKYGSRHSNAGFALAADRRDTITPAEAAFIEARDGFYQASVGETGWPYVQFRGGPAGFLKVLDERTIGYADFRGNVQYLSVGNLEADGRVSLILMDYPNRARLKIWGRARVVDAAADPALIARVEVPTYRARVERAIVITVDALDWNCPQHITPRYTQVEVQRLLDDAEIPLAKRIAELESANQRSATALSASTTGDGPLALEVVGVRRMTATVAAIEVRNAADGDLPLVEAGAHVRLPVRLPDGSESARAYSIASDPSDRRRWEFMVKREIDGVGGSRFMHGLRLGDVLNAALPQNGFELHAGDEPALLMAAGIGITPMRSMAHALRRRGSDFTLHWAVVDASAAPGLDTLRALLGDRLHLHESGRVQRLDVASVVAAAEPHGHLYACGPTRFLSDVQAAFARRGEPAGRLQVERFSVDGDAADAAFTIELANSGTTIEVPRDRSLLDVLEAAGHAVPSICRTGTCGTCTVKVLAGTPMHRDLALSPLQRNPGALMCACVSRSDGGTLVLDL